MRLIQLILALILFTNFGIGQEKHLANITKLTSGGDNAEAYFSPDGSKLVMQVTNPKIGAYCDQIYVLDLNQEEYTTDDLKLVSTGKGRTTCAFFMPDGEHVIYASTHEGNEDCPPKPEPRADGKYVWPIYPDFDIYMADLDGNIVKKLTDEPGYDAEAVVSPDGKKIAFTSLRSGDLEIYVMDIDGSNIVQVTDGLGYDGGAFFTNDSKRLIFRSSRPKTPEDIAEYKELLNQGLVMPTNMEIYMVDIDGKNLEKKTDLGKANWSPYMHPSDEKILFSSNHHATRGYDFQIYMMDLDGSNMEQITYESEFNAFPMFSYDGKKLVFSSNRIQDEDRETNVYIADWVEGDQAERFNGEQVKEHITYLASDELEGRLTGSPGEAKAAAYLIQEVENLGLGTFLSNDYEHPFEYTVKINPHGTVTEKNNTGKNVVAFLDNEADKTILIGAHYDHLGRNEHKNSTMADADGLIHNGADDNASGVAVVLELARMLSQNDKKEDANYVFAFFSGEEDGLIGSKNLAEELSVQKMVPAWAPKSWKSPVVAMINLDMIGRMNEDKVLSIGGAGTSPIFVDLINRYKPAGVNLAIDSSGVGPSDYTSFYLKDIPVLAFFTGTHEDYHKPSDDEHKINYRGVEMITHYAFGMVTELAAAKSIPFQKTKVQQETAKPRYKVTMGIMPNYSSSGDGLKVDGVMDGRAADNAGMEQGDIITKIGDYQVTDIYTYMEALAKFTEGDKTTVEYERAGKKIEAEITF